MAFVPQTPSLGYPPLDDFIDATGDDYIQPVPFGTIITATDPTYGAGEFIFLKGIASTVAGSWVTYDDGFQSKLVALSDVGPVAVAMAATVADKAGWYQIQGRAVGKADDVSDSGVVYIDTATEGVADDAVSAGNKIFNAKWASDDDTATGTAAVRIARPFLNGEST